MLVWASNPARRLNRYFLLTTFLIIAWLLGLFIITIQESVVSVTFWSRQVSATASLLPLGFFILRLVVLQPYIRLSQLCYKLRYLFVAVTVVVALCQTDFFLSTAYFSNQTETIPIVDYGAGLALYILFFVLTAVGMVFSIFDIFKNTQGVQRTEGQFLLLGWLFGFSFGVFLFAFSNLSGSPEAARFLPLFPLVMNSFVAYGIATHRILSVSVVLQRLTAFILMTIYLASLYLVTVWLADRLFYMVVEETSNLSHLLAALVVAFSVIPAQGLMKNFSSRLFFASKSFDIDQMLEETRHIFQEVSSEDKLLADFSSLVIQTFKTPRVVLLRIDPDGVYRQRYVFPEQESSVLLEPHIGLIKLLKRDHQPFTIDTLERMRSSRLIDGARKELNSIGAAVAVGSFAHKKLETVILLFPKSTGAIFDAREQRALQILSDQLAVALENSSLYTAVQDGKLYNETLLDSMASGLVAVDENHQITVFNQRAQAITGLSFEHVVNHSVTMLPGAMVTAIEAILQTGSGFRDKDMTIPVGTGQVPIRVSGSVFHSHTGKTIGALLVFSDMTLLRKMEDQIRRTDRLSSIGTLSAGMAHEIKNPLVTIKTFTELLPNQYSDDEFRNTFFDLVGQEVQRIDAIVNRLLNFARPANVSLKPVLFHDVVKNSLRLMEQQLTKYGIKLEESLVASHHLVMADADQLNQAFVNLFLNAIQAMESGGVLSVTTTQLRSKIRLDIRDTGCGLSEEQRKHIFDPFFTTKEEGVGLGLSISYGIIQEHEGVVDVESEKGQGAVFHVEFPLIDEREVVNG
jgi:signal transduction histidine kinase